MSTKINQTTRIQVGGVDIPLHLVAQYSVEQRRDYPSTLNLAVYAYGCRINGKRADFGDDTPDQLEPAPVESASGDPAGTAGKYAAMYGQGYLYTDPSTGETTALDPRDVTVVMGVSDPEATQVTPMTELIRIQELLNQRRRLTSILGQLLNPHAMESGHPGAPCLRTRWISEATVENWRREITAILQTNAQSTPMTDSHGG